MRISGEAQARDLAVAEAKLAYYRDGVTPSDEALVQHLASWRDYEWTIRGVAHLIERNGGDVDRVVQLVADRLADNRRLHEEANPD